MTSVLIVKIGAIGDVVMALPMVEALRQGGGCRITWLCGGTVEPLLRQVTGIDEILTVDEGRLLGGKPAGQLSVLLATWRRLFLRRFEVILVAHADRRYRLLAASARGPRRSFSSLRPLFPVPGRHHSDEYLRLATGEEGALRPPARLPEWQLPLRKELAAATARRPAVALAPGGARNHLADDFQRRWPLANYRLLAERLADCGASVVVTGGPGDLWVREAFAGLPVVDLVGRTSVVDLVALYRACSVVVTHDSGPLHLAGLAGTPTVALFGPTNPAEKVPRHQRSVTIWGGAELPCRPCYDGKFYARCADPRCMAAISPEEVAAAVRSVLAPSSNVISGRFSRR